MGPRCNPVSASRGAERLRFRLPRKWRNPGEIRVWRNRAVTAALVLALLALARGLWPEPAVRMEVQYIFVITLGYGHLIGGAVFSRRRMAELAPTEVPPRLFWGFVALTIATLFAAYFTLYDVFARDFLLFASPLLAISVWHTVENDAAVSRADARGLPGPVARNADSQALTLGISAFVLAVAAASIAPGHLGATETGVGLARLASSGLLVIGALLGGFSLLRAGFHATGLAGAVLLASSLLLLGTAEESAWLAAISFGDVFAATTLYHLIQWLVLFADRGRGRVPSASRESASALWRRIAWVHAPAVLICVAVLWLDSGASSLLSSSISSSISSSVSASLYRALFSPSIYLFWSSLHVVQTALVRGLSSRDSVPAAHGAVS